MYGMIAYGSGNAASRVVCLALLFFVSSVVMLGDYLSPPARKTWKVEKAYETTSFYRTPGVLKHGIGRGF